MNPDDLGKLVYNEFWSMMGGPARWGWENLSAQDRAPWIKFGQQIALQLEGAIRAAIEQDIRDTPGFWDMHSSRRA